MVACWQDTHCSGKMSTDQNLSLRDRAVLQLTGSKGQTAVGEGKDPDKPTSLALLKR